MRTQFSIHECHELRQDSSSNNSALLVIKAFAYCCSINTLDRLLHMDKSARPKDLLAPLMSGVREDFPSSVRAPHSFPTVFYGVLQYRTQH